jgi:O-antigen/teichoic acid export membrane protein
MTGTARPDAPTGAAEPLRRTAGRVLQGAAVLAASQIASRAIGMVFTLTLAHLLSIEDFGTYNLALSAIVIAGMVQDLGLSRSVVKAVARAPAEAAGWVGRLAPLKLGLGVIAALLLPGGAALAGYGSGVVGILAIVALLLPAANLWLLLENAGQGLHAIRVLATGYLANTLLQSGLGLVAALATGGDLRAVAGALVVASLLNAALMWRLLTGVAGPIRLRLDPAFCRRVLAESLPYLGAALALVALGRVEPLLLGLLADEAEVARFVAAFKLFEAAIFVVYAAQIAMNPTVARLILHDRAGFGRWFGWELSLAAALLLPALVFGLLAAGPLIGLLFPPAYAAAAAPLAVLLAALPVTALQALAGGALMLTDRQGAVLALNAAVVATQVALNLLLIPGQGALGAALAVAGSQALSALTGIALAGHWLLPDWRALRPLGRVLLVQAAAAAGGLAARAVAGDAAGAAAALLLLVAGCGAIRLRLLPPG